MNQTSSIDKRDDSWLCSQEWADLKNPVKKSEKLNNLRTLLDKYFTIEIENLGQKSEIGKGFLSYLTKGDLEAKIESYITSTYANWGDTYICNAFYEKVFKKRVNEIKPNHNNT